MGNFISTGHGNPAIATIFSHIDLRSDLSRYHYRVSYRMTEHTVVRGEVFTVRLYPLFKGIGPRDLNICNSQHFHTKTVPSKTTNLIWRGIGLEHEYAWLTPASHGAGPRSQIFHSCYVYARPS